MNMCVIFVILRHTVRLCHPLTFYHHGGPRTRQPQPTSRVTRQQAQQNEPNDPARPSTSSGEPSTSQRTRNEPPDSAHDQLQHPQASSSDAPEQRCQPGPDPPVAVSPSHTFSKPNPNNFSYRRRRPDVSVILEHLDLTKDFRDSSSLPKPPNSLGGVWPSSKKDCLPQGSIPLLCDSSKGLCPSGFDP